MSAAAIEKVLDGPAGYSVAILAALAAVIIIWNKFNSQQGPPGSTGASIGNNIGQGIGSLITGLGAAIQKPFDDYFNPPSTQADTSGGWDQ